MIPWLNDILLSFRVIRGSGDGRSTRLGIQAVKVALSELGNGEMDHNNRGADVVRYRNGVDDGEPWCAAFVSYCFEQAARQLQAELTFKRSARAKTLFANIGRSGRFVDSPLAGDVACYHRGAYGSGQGHIALVVSANVDGYTTIEGNKGGFPSRVKQFYHVYQEGNLLGFARPYDFPGF